MAKRKMTKKTKNKQWITTNCTAAKDWAAPIPNKNRE